MKLYEIFTSKSKYVYIGKSQSLYVWVWKDISYTHKRSRKILGIIKNTHIINTFIMSYNLK